MRLAQLVKRQLGAGEKPPVPLKKRKLSSDGAPEPTAISPADLAELRRKNTLTARRKLKKLQRLLSQGKGVLVDAPGRRDASGAVQSEGSDSEGEGAGAAPVAAGASYEALLASLQSSSSAFSEAYQQRQRELAGDSDEGEPSEDEGSQELPAEESPGSLAAGDNGAEGSAGEQEEAAAHASSEDGGSGEHGSEEEGEFGEASDGDEQQEEEEEAGLGGSSAAAAAGQAAAEATPAAPGLVSTFDLHLGAELSESRVAELAAGSAGFAPAPPTLQAWLPAARLESSHGTALPASAPARLAEYGVKNRLATLWSEVHGRQAGSDGAAAASARSNGSSAPASQGKVSGDSADGDFVDDQQRVLFSLLNSYCDVLHPCSPYPTSPDAPDPAMDAVLLHVLNHCARTADRIKRNSERADSAPDPPRDQGFTRPKVLLLLPMRNVALRVVRRLLRLGIRETRTDSVQNKRRLEEEFGGGEEGEEEGAELSARAQLARANKPPEHRALFAGNMDDHFRLGIKITRGAVRLYSDFFQSDILVASPLALATKLEEAAAEGEGGADFLSSIEILVVGRADVMAMQNWSHVTAVVAALNRLPRKQRDVDIMRVREWYLGGRAKNYRQTLVLSGLVTPEMNALLGRTCANHGGVVRLAPVCKGVLSSGMKQVRQIFERLPAAPGGPATAADARFEHFTRVAWPRIREAARGSGQLIYIPSYFDFVRVRNFLRSEAADFAGLCEYTERGDMARARTLFAEGRIRVLLYTERAQFYNRHHLRGVKDVLFYQLPEHGAFYREVVNFLQQANEMEVATATVLYGRYDALRLERVVGSDYAGKLLKKGGTGTFLVAMDD